MRRRLLMVFPMAIVAFVGGHSALTMVWTIQDGQPIAFLGASMFQWIAQVYWEEGLRLWRKQ